MNDFQFQLEARKKRFCQPEEVEETEAKNKNQSIEKMEEIEQIIDNENCGNNEDDDITMRIANQIQQQNFHYIEDRIKQEQYDAELALQLQRQFDNEVKDNENENNHNINDSNNESNNDSNNDSNDENNGNINITYSDDSNNNNNHNDVNDYHNHYNNGYNDYNHTTSNNNTNHYYNHHNRNNYNGHQQILQSQNQQYEHHHSQQPQMVSRSFSYSINNNRGTHVAFMSETINGNTVSRTITNVNNSNNHNNRNRHYNNAHTNNNNNNRNNDFFSLSFFPGNTHDYFHDNTSSFNLMSQNTSARQSSFPRINSNYHHNHNHTNHNNNGQLSIFEFPNYPFFNFDDFTPYFSDSSNGASEEQIQALPEDCYRGNKNNAVKKNQIENKTCCICLEEFRDQDSIKRLPCLHIFHSHEIDNWLRINRVCPVCRIPIHQ